MADKINNTILDNLSRAYAQIKNEFAKFKRQNTNFIYLVIEDFSKADSPILDFYAQLPNLLGGKEIDSPVVAKINQEVNRINKLYKVPKAVPRKNTGLDDYVATDEIKDALKKVKVKFSGLNRCHIVSMLRMVGTIGQDNAFLSVYKGNKYDLIYYLWSPYILEYSFLASLFYSLYCISRGKEDPFNLKNNEANVGKILQYRKEILKSYVYPLERGDVSPYVMAAHMVEQAQTSKKIQGVLPSMKQSMRRIFSAMTTMEFILTNEKQ